jgi:hypothetical protein
MAGKNSPAFWVRIEATMSQDVDGVLVSRVVMSDISEHRKMDSLLQEKAEKLEAEIANIKTLTGMIPICSHCRKIRTEGGSWSQLETYVIEHTDA